jgi:ABC-type xylose transport system substrate-binding protein
MTKLTFDTERWLRSQAKIYALRKNFGMAATFERCADDVRNAKAELDALKSVGRDVVAHWVVDNIQATEGAEESIREFARLCGEEEK